jgi:LmbE family N-acetylglucosaminyl deacetylase
LDALRRAQAAMGGEQKRRTYDSSIRAILMIKTIRAEVTISMDIEQPELLIAAARHRYHIDHPTCCNVDEVIVDDYLQALRILIGAHVQPAGCNFINSDVTLEIRKR